jgi:hypothetical protein
MRGGEGGGSDVFEDGRCEIGWDSFEFARE